MCILSNKFGVRYHSARVTNKGTAYPTFLDDHKSDEACANDEVAAKNQTVDGSLHSILSICLTTIF